MQDDLFISAFKLSILTTLALGRKMNRSVSLDDNFKNCMDKVKLFYILLASKYKEIEEKPTIYCYSQSLDYL